MAKAQEGMTLIEVLVALLLLSMLSVGLFATFRVSQRTYAQLVRNDVAARDVLATQRLLRRFIESAYPATPSVLQPRYGVEGTQADLELTASAPGYNDRGYYRYHLFTEMRSDGLKNLIVQYGYDREGGMLADARHADAAAQEVLLTGIKDMEFSYLPSEESTGAAPDSLWISRWQRRVELPRLIQVEVHFPLNDRRSWPLLFAAPIVTDNARYEFDVVSQTCRGSAS